MTDRQHSTRNEDTPAANAGIFRETPNDGPSRKRSSEDGSEVLDDRPTKKSNHLRYGSLSIPRNDAVAFWQGEQKGLFYAFCPLDHTNLKRAVRHRFLSKVVFGMHGNRCVQALVVDEETGIPWTVPKVTLQFERIDYKSEHQPSTMNYREEDGQPVSPSAIPRVDEMTRSEYEDAVETGDPRVPRTASHTYEHCMESEVGWLKYEDR